MVCAGDFTIVEDSIVFTPRISLYNTSCFTFLPINDEFVEDLEVFTFVPIATNDLDIFSPTSATFNVEVYDDDGK